MSPNSIPYFKCLDHSKIPCRGSCVATCILSVSSGTYRSLCKGKGACACQVHMYVYPDDDVIVLPAHMHLYLGSIPLIADSLLCGGLKRSRGLTQRRLHTYVAVKLESG